MIVATLIFLSILLFAVRRKLEKHADLNKFRLLQRLHKEGFVGPEQAYPILYLPMGATSFEEVGRMISIDTCKPLIIILESPLWYAAVKKKQWAHHIVIPYSEVNEWMQGTKESFIWDREGYKILEIRHVKEFLQVDKTREG